jgi:hypothetical protein
MTSLYLIFGTGLIGVLGHWVTRWSQGRTQSTFWEYLVAYKAHTISSVFANIASSGLIYASTPEDIGGRALVLVAIGAYTAGYTLDSTLNKDKSTSDRLMQERVKELQRENAKPSLADAGTDPETASNRDRLRRRQGGRQRPQAAREL